MTCLVVSRRVVSCLGVVLVLVLPLLPFSCILLSSPSSWHRIVSRPAHPTTPSDPTPSHIFHEQDVTIRKTDNKTGEVLEVTRPMTTVERTEVDLPKHLQKAFEAQREGKEWKDTRRRKGRWGPTPDEQVCVYAAVLGYRIEIYDFIGSRNRFFRHVGNRTETFDVLEIPRSIIVRVCLCVSRSFGGDVTTPFPIVEHPSRCINVPPTPLPARPRHPRFPCFAKRLLPRRRRRG